MWKKIVFLSILSMLVSTASSVLAQTPRLQKKEFSSTSAKTSSHPFNKNILTLAQGSTEFKRASVTESRQQVNLVRLHPGESISEETHRMDQILVFVAGQGEIVLNGKKTPVKLNRLVFIPAGVRHTIINTGKVDMKLYSVYARTDHKSGTIYQAKKESIKQP
jgi:mannose-6-phosphate isomerase-like protein (cupin superfamily)